MSSCSEQSLIETEALGWYDTEVMNADGNGGLGGECVVEYGHIFFGHPNYEKPQHIFIKIMYV